MILKEGDKVILLSDDDTVGKVVYIDESQDKDGFPVLVDWPRDGCMCHKENELKKVD